MNSRGRSPRMHERGAQPSKEKGLRVTSSSRNKIPSADLVRRVSDIEDELDLRVINSDRRGTSSVTTRGATNMVRERWSKPNLKSR